MMTAPRQRGIALVIVLWFIALLSILALGFSKSMRSEAQITHNLLAANEARHLARAAVERGIYDLLQARGQPAAIFFPDQPHSFQLGTATVTYYIEDERGKININQAPKELIEGLLTNLDLDLDAETVDSITDAILDWRDDNDLRRLNGAEAADYRAAGMAEPGNRPFEHPEELLQVMGMNAAIFARLAPFITLYTADAKINQDSAWREVLLALPGVSNSEVNAIMDARQAISSDTPNGVIPRLSGLKGRLTRARGPVYTVHGMATLPGGIQAAERKVVWITAGKRQMPYHVLHSDLNPPPRPAREQQQ